MRSREFPVSTLQDQADARRLYNAPNEIDGNHHGKVQPPPMLFTREGHSLYLGDTFRSRSAFLICSGPSLASHDLSALNRRGVLTLAVNNAATVHRPNLWCCVDDPGNFSDAIWRDPAIWKFVPLAHMEKHFTVRDEQAELVQSKQRVGDMPAVFGFRRNEDFRADQWLYEDTFNWGSHSNKVDAYGNKGSRSVMYVALRLLYYLGVRRIYLLGCDFRMQLGQQNYAFEQDRSRSSVNGNNSSYRILNDRLGRLLPYFEKENLSIFNCTPNSGLTVFPSISYEEAIQEATSLVPSTILTAGMYDRKQREANLAAKKAVSNAPGTAVAPVNGSAVSHATAPLPDITLVVPVTEAALPTLGQVWETWIHHKPRILEQPVLFLCSPGIEATELSKITSKHSNARIVKCSHDSSKPDCLTRTALQAIVSHITSSWFLWLDPFAVATGQPDWISPSWFASMPAKAEPVLIGAKWGYAKPSHRFEMLDDWADRIPALQGHPRLNIPFEEGTDRVSVDTVGSWSLLASTPWVAECLKESTIAPPGDFDQTVLHYWAMRQNKPVLLLPFKKLGWTHSFNRSSTRILSECESALRGKSPVVLVAQ